VSSTHLEVVTGTAKDDLLLLDVLLLGRHGFLFGGGYRRDVEGATGNGCESSVVQGWERGGGDGCSKDYWTKRK
jgi:hypothetical protein